MNPQIDAFGKNIIGFNPAISKNNFIDICDLFTSGFQLSPPRPEGTQLRVLIYFDKGSDTPTSYIKSEQDLSQWVIIYKDQQYQCKDSRTTNSDLFKTIIVAFDDKDIAIDFSADNAWK